MQRIIQWVTIFYVIVLTFLLEMPSSLHSEASSMVIEPAKGYTHLMTFMLLGFLTALSREKRSLLFWGCVLLLYAFTTEVLQGLLHPFFQRTFDVKDLCQNSLGIVLGIALGHFCRPLIKSAF